MAAGAGLPKPVQDAVKAGNQAERRRKRQALRNYFIEYVDAETKPTFEPLHAKLAEAEKGTRPAR